MSLQRQALPPRWSRQELDQERLRAIANFVQERRGEGVDAYRSEVIGRMRVVSELFLATDDLRAFHGAILVHHREFIDAARFLCGPPVSEDDLDSLSGHSVSKRARIEPEAAEAAASLLRALFDPVRLFWLQEGAAPTNEGRRAAIAWTAGLWASERQRTSRRTLASRRQEHSVAQSLVLAGLTELPKPTRIDLLDELPRGRFCREAQLNGAKCDIPVRLLDGRLLAIECKVSNSAINSVKRLLRETGGKARAWRNAFGQQVLPAVVLSGVYKLANLLEAQDEYGIAIFWQHELGPLTRFVENAR